jgi:hypothetical protein
MEYRVIIKSYEPNRKDAAGNRYNHLKSLEQTLNHDVTPASEREALKDFKMKEILATPFGDKIIYTVIFEKPTTHAEIIAAANQ